MSKAHNFIEVPNLSEILNSARKVLRFLDPKTLRLTNNVIEFAEESGLMSENQYSFLVGMLFINKEEEQDMSVGESFKGEIIGEVRKETCPRCGRYKLAGVKIMQGSEGDDCVICIGCGYFRLSKIGMALTEGVAFLVECSQCKKCQTWIRYPLSIFSQHKDVRRILGWRCDLCGHKQRVSDSLVDLEKSSTNWYSRLIIEAKIIRK